ncbi:MAG: LPS export ABC transporter periplasmic protein LptC [Candidatus Omnitrophota bacterium]
MGRGVKVIPILIFLFISLCGNLECSVFSGINKDASGNPGSVSASSLQQNSVGIEQEKAQKGDLEQTIDEFNLSGFTEEGSKAWEISGETADIFSGQINLNDFTGTVYQQDKIVLTADKGSFNKAQNKVYLEKDVVITTESGVKLTTDYLDWAQETSEFASHEPVEITKEGIFISGVGIKGDTSLKNIDLKRDVKVEINNKDGKIIITCSGPLSINYLSNIAVFNKDVSADDGESQMQADSMEVIFEASDSDSSKESFIGKSGRIKKIIAKGNVKITREDNISFSEGAIYNAEDRNITLSGRPKLIIPSQSQTYGIE